MKLARQSAHQSMCVGRLGLFRKDGSEHVFGTATFDSFRDSASNSCLCSRNTRSNPTQKVVDVYSKSIGVGSVESHSGGSVENILCVYSLTESHSCGSVENLLCVYSLTVIYSP